MFYKFDTDRGYWRGAGAEASGTRPLAIPRHAFGTGQHVFQNLVYTPRGDGAGVLNVAWTCERESEACEAVADTSGLLTLTPMLITGPGLTS